jgi:hypothetical protein
VVDKQFLLLHAGAILKLLDLIIFEVGGATALVAHKNHH